ncbi:MAG: phage portal protein [Oscillospiraceae bacterium]
MNILSAIKEVISKLFDKKTVADKLGVSIAMSQSMTDAIKLWSDLYEGKAPWLNDDVHSKRLAYAVTHEMARLVTLEMSSELNGGKRAEYLSPFYSKLIADAPVFVEKACAMGGIMLKPYLTPNGIATAYIQADSFFPTAFDSSGNITGCIFTERKIVGKRYYTRLEYHSFSAGSYTVINKAYMSENASELGRSISLANIPEWAQLQEETNFTANRPLFSYFKMPGANRIDSSSPLGVSIFSDAVGAMQDADEQYSRLLWEFEGSELAVFVDETALEHKDGKVSAPKLNKRLMRGLDQENLYEVFSPNIREQSLLNGLDAILRDVEYLSGLAYGTLSKQTDTAKTATEIKASRQRSYCTVHAIQTALEKALTDYIGVLDDLCTLYNLAPADKLEASFNFDDSLVTDAETQQKIWLQEVSAGLMQPYEYRMRQYGETEEQAKKMLPAAFEGEE